MLLVQREGKAARRVSGATLAMLLCAVPAMFAAAFAAGWFVYDLL